MVGPLSILIERFAAQLSLPASSNEKDFPTLECLKVLSLIVTRLTLPKLTLTFSIL